MRTPALTALLCVAALSAEAKSCDGYIEDGNAYYDRAIRGHESVQSQTQRIQGQQERAYLCTRVRELHAEAVEVIDDYDWAGANYIDATSSAVCDRAGREAAHYNLDLVRRNRELLYGLRDDFAAHLERSCE